MADGTQFKGAVRCDVELPYKLLVHLEYKKVEYERILQTLQRNSKISTTNSPGKLTFWFERFFHGVIRRLGKSR